MSEEAKPDRSRRNRRATRELIVLLSPDAADEEFEAAAPALNEVRGIPHPSPGGRDRRRGELHA